MPDAPVTPPELPAPEPTDWQAEATKWKDLADATDKRAKRFEDTAKANATAARELEALRAKSMTDQERAVEEARKEARSEVLREVGGKLAQSAIRVAAAGRSVDVDALLEGIDAARFLDAAGDPDTKAIAAWVDRVAPLTDAERKKTGNVVPKEGTSAPTTSSTGDDRAFVRQLFGAKT